nr:MAG TPA: hypothetical protein [Caudoviricetes sp.]
MKMKETHLSMESDSLHLTRTMLVFLLMMAL